MSDSLSEPKRRTVLSAVGAGLLSSVASGSAVAAGVDASEMETDTDGSIELGDEIKEGDLLATHIETGEEFVFASVDEYDPADLPGGEYRLEYRVETADGPISATEYVEVDAQGLVTANESGAELRLSMQSNTGIAPDGTLDVWVSTSMGDGGAPELVGDASVEFELIDDDDGEVVLEETVTTDENGTAVAELDLDIEEGAYSLEAEWIEEGVTASEFIEAGPIVEFAFTSGPITPNEQVAIGVSRTEDGDPVPGTIDIELETPDGTTETIPTEINDGGVGTVEFTPESTGEHRLSHPTTFGRSFDVLEQRFLTEGFRLRDQLVDEPIEYGGFVVDSTLSPVDNEPVEVELRERFGEEVFETVETTTDGDGRLTVEFEPQQEPDSYTVQVRTTTGTVIADERIQLSEFEEPDDDPTPEMSVSIDDWSHAPGEEVVAEIELVDSAGEPIADSDVTILENAEFSRGAFIAKDEVTTDGDGTATYTTTVPDPYLEDERFRISAVTTVDGDGVEGDDTTSVSSVSFDTRAENGPAPGETFDGTVTLSDTRTEEPLSGVDVGVIYGRGNPLRGGNLGADAATTDDDGAAEFSFQLPDDIQYRFRFNVVLPPYNRINRRRIWTLTPFFVDTDVPDEVDPGDTLEVTYSVDDHDTDTVGMVFMETAWEATVEVVDPGETVSLDVPSTAAGDTARLRTVVMDAEGRTDTGFDTVYVTESETDDDSDEDSGDDEAPVVVGDDPATDTTGDGLLNDVNGDGAFDITDVQVFFENLESDAIQANAGQFDFSGGGGDVTIADVQALFEQLQEQ